MITGTDAIPLWKPMLCMYVYNILSSCYVNAVNTKQSITDKVLHGLKLDR